jgi:type IV pilus assembly protein PilB
MSISSYRSILEINDIKNIVPNFNMLKLVSRDLATRSQTCILWGEKKQIDIVTTNNYPEELGSIIQFLWQQWYKITTHYTDEQSFQHCLRRYDEAEHRSTELAKQLHNKQEAIGIDAIKLIKELFQEREKYSESDFINEIIKLAYQAGSSDLHFQNEQSAVVLRLRIDGILHNIIEFDHKEFKKYLLKIKFMSHAKMNIDYLPQDARFEIIIKNNENTTRTIDIRLSLIPGLDGESIAMRFLDPLKGLVELDKIWFLPIQQQILNWVLNKMSGMVVITWPTWSGKTTTLYSIINAIDHKKYKIITLEDPIEYHLDGIQQSQIDEYRWYTFDAGLKATLRHDPDVIMVWEIRTLETAETAIAAAMTWHLVLCTLHTNSAIEAIQRLINMGVKPYTLIGSLNVVVWQKLIHKVNPKNIALSKITDDQVNTLKTTLVHIHDLDWHVQIPLDIIKEQENSDIYKGRIMVAEVLQVNEDIKQMILNGATTQNIEGYVMQHNYIRILDSAMIALCQHQTSWEEIVRLM